MLRAFGAAALSGTYVFDFAGVQGSNGLSQIGEFTANGAGNISGGLMDINDGGVATPQVSITGGTYSVNSSTGRGTATLVTSGATFHLSFYVVSRGSADIRGHRHDATSCGRDCAADSQFDFQCRFAQRKLCLSAG